MWMMATIASFTASISFAQGDYATDPHLSQATKNFLKPLNSGGQPLESLPLADARNVLVGAQNAFPIDLSGIEESESLWAQVA
jgi:hypothetical protein